MNPTAIIYHYCSVTFEEFVDKLYALVYKYSNCCRSAVKAPSLRPSANRSIHMLSSVFSALRKDFCQGTRRIFRQYVPYIRELNLTRDVKPPILAITPIFCIFISKRKKKQPKKDKNKKQKRDKFFDIKLLELLAHSVILCWILFKKYNQSLLGIKFLLHAYVSVNFINLPSLSFGTLTILSKNIGDLLDAYAWANASHRILKE